MTVLIILAVGDLIAHVIYKHRVVPTWMDAPWHEKACHLLWPLGIIVYLQYPKREATS